MSEHPEAFGMESTTDQSANDLYSDNEESSDSVSSSSVAAFASLPESQEEVVVKKENEVQLKRSSSERQLINVGHQELGHRRTVSYDLQGGKMVSKILSAL